MTADQNSGVEQFSTTLMEKFLAVVLTVFLVIAGIWMYTNWLTFPGNQHGYQPQCLQSANTSPVTSSSVPPSPGQDSLARELGRCGSASDRLAVMSYREALSRSENTAGVDAAQRHRDEAREAYRTALEAHANTQQLKLQYDTSVDRLTAERAKITRATGDVELLRMEGTAARKRIDAAIHNEQKHIDRQNQHRELYTFLARLAFVAIALGLSFALLQATRTRHSRYTILAMSMVAASALLGFGMAVDYLDIRHSGPIIISAIGIGLTIATFMSYQRFLARRIPRRRIRKHQCMFCGFPVAQEAHCEGCGRSAFAPCSTCNNRRRVGTVHCGDCGSA